MTPSIPPRISLVTPNYNGQEFLDIAIKSVIKQNYINLDYVIVDGASTDLSQSIIESYHDDVSKVIIEPDDGHADALNKGFAHTDGEIMGWINSDDVLLPGSLSIVGRIFELYPEVEWITGLPSTCDESGNLTYVGPLKSWSQARFLCGDHLWIQQESTFWRRSLWERAGGLDTDWKVANDFDLWARFFRHASLHSIDTLLGCFRIRKGQRSADYRSLYMQEVQQILSREVKELPSDRLELYSGLPLTKGTASGTAFTKEINLQIKKFDPFFIIPEEITRGTASVFHPVRPAAITHETQIGSSGDFKSTIMRNWRYIMIIFLAVGTACTMATALPEFRVWIALFTGIGFTSSLSIALAIKTRRIIKFLLKSNSDNQQNIALSSYYRHISIVEKINNENKDSF